MSETFPEIPETFSKAFKEIFERNFKNKVAGNPIEFQKSLQASPKQFQTSQKSEQVKSARSAKILFIIE